MSLPRQLLLAVVCAVPGLIERTFHPPTAGVGLDIYINLYNSIFLFTFVSVVFAVVRYASLLLLSCKLLHGAPTHFDGGERAE